MALRYVQSVKLGAYMWRNGYTGSKKGLMWVIFEAFGTLEEPKKAPIGLMSYVRAAQLVRDHF